MTGILAPPDKKLSSSARSHTIADSGYDANVFAGKKEQMVQVGDYLDKSGFLPKELVASANGLIQRYYTAIWALMTITLLSNL
ncbi:hypothetical protein G6F42_013656 [Rhizopus arrhizus]|nr:hypothetical protein G6F42_013656 [Rhizopus arrhizus]